MPESGNQGIIELWHMKRTFFPVLAGPLKGLQETAPLFIAKIINGVSQDGNRQTPFEAAGDFVPTEAGYESLDDFSLQ